MPGMFMYGGTTAIPCHVLYSIYLFERSEFLIPTWVTPQYRASSQKKNLCVCSTNLGFSGGSANRYCCRTLRQYDTRYVLCTRYACTWFSRQKSIRTYVMFLFQHGTPTFLVTKVLEIWVGSYTRREKENPPEILYTKREIPQGAS